MVQVLKMLKEMAMVRFNQIFNNIVSFLLCIAKIKTFRKPRGKISNSKVEDEFDQFYLLFFR